MPRSRTSYLALPDADAVLNAVPAKAKAKAKAMLPRSGWNVKLVIGKGISVWDALSFLGLHHKTDSETGQKAS